MSYNDIEFTFDFSPLLRSREQIRVITHFTVGGGSDFLLALFIPFVSIEPETERIRLILFAEADALVSQWALQFDSAEVALDPTAYHSLSKTLSAITAPHFNVRRVVIRQVIPLSPKVPKPPPPPKTRLEQEIHALEEAVHTITELRSFEKKSKENNPDIWNDDVLGPLMASKLYDKMHQFLFDGSEL